MDTFNICQWNSRSAISNKANLEILLQQNNIDIDLISETWFKPGSYISFPSYNVVRKDRVDGKGGVAILIKNNIQFSEITSKVDFNEIMYVAVKIMLNNGSFLSLISLYIKPQSKISAFTWNNFFSNFSAPFLIGGDFNAHHVAWGCHDNDTLGNTLLDVINDNNLVFLNNGSYTRLNPSGGNNSAIDLSITTPCMQDVLDWITLEDTFGSDHLPIIITCQTKLRLTSSFSHKKWNVIKANWDLFFVEATLNFSNYNDLNYSEFIQILNTVLEKTIPTISNTANKKRGGKSWWNQNCEEVVKKRKECFRNYKLNPNMDNLLQYKKSDAFAKKIIKEAKRESWRSFCLSLNQNS